MVFGQRAAKSVENADQSNIHGIANLIRHHIERVELATDLAVDIDNDDRLGISAVDIFRSVQLLS